MAGTTETMRVLHVDDEPAFVDLSAEFLTRQLPEIEVVTEGSAAAGLERLDGEPIDCIVSDYDMPDQDGLGFLESVRERDPDLPFILFTGKGSEEIASEAISAGVTDYLQKSAGTDQYAVLANRIEQSVARYRTERALSRSEQRYRTLVETSPVPIIIYDDEGILQYVNNAALELVEAEDEAAVLGESVATFVHPDDRAQTMDRMASILEERRPVGAAEVRVRTLTGKTKWATVAGAPTHFEGERVGQAVLNDVTERNERERRLETLISNLPGMIYRCRNEPDWPMELVRGECEPLVGYPAEALESDAVVWGEDIIHDEDREPMWSTVQAALEANEAFEVTYRVVTADGETKWVWERGRGVYDADGELEGIEGFITDIASEEVRARAADGRPD